MNKRILFLLIAVLYFFILRNSYSYLYDIFGYVGFENEANNLRFIFSTFALLILLMTLHYFVIDNIVWSTTAFILVLYTIPAFIYFEFNPQMKFSYFFGHFCLPFIFSFLAHFFPSFNFFRLRIKYADNILILLMIILIIPIIILYGFNFNFSLFQFNDEIYDVRFESIEKANRLTSYLGPFLSSVLCPIVLLRSISRKNIIGIILTLFVTLILFQNLAHKSSVLSLIILFFFYYVNNFKKIVIYFLLLILSFLLLLAMDFDFFNVLITTFILYRFLFIPVQIGTFYFDFFENKSTYWTQSAFNPFSNYQFELKPANLIGDYYFNNPLVGANTGIIADGYMNAGFFGILFNILLFSIFMLVFLKSKINPKYFGIVFLNLISFQNSPLNTVMITHGFLLTIFIFYFLNFNEDKIIN